jgi:hypothetical protein
MALNLSAEAGILARMRHLSRARRATVRVCFRLQPDESRSRRDECFDPFRR